LISTESLSQDKRKVIVAHPGTQHSYQTALGLQEAGMLKAYLTGFYYKKPSFVSTSAHLFPTRFASRLERELNRRRKEELDQNLVRTLPIPELMYVASARLKCLGRWSDQLLRWRNERFDAHVARLVAFERPDAVICYNSCALNTFTTGKELGVTTVLDQTIGHVKAGIKILREEARLHPEFADSLNVNAPDLLIERASAEPLAADWVLAPSGFVRDTLVAEGVSPSKIVVLPYGADSARFHPSTRRDDAVFRILFVGGVSQRKGIKYLLEAFKQLRLPNAELVLVGGIVGSGEGLKPYLGNFRHITHVPHREVHVWFQNADIFVYPSLFEGSALAIYEALASGLPVITTPNAGSVVRDSVDGFIIPVRDVETLMEKILLLYRDHELRSTMGFNARARAEQFTWEQYRRRLGTLLVNFVKDQA